jgi:hypothetical protein
VTGKRNTGATGRKVQADRFVEATPAPLTLSEIQHRLQRALLNGDDAVLDTILDNSRTTRQTLFGVYRNAYVGRLVDILQSDFQLTCDYCGADYFREQARAFVGANPSHTQNARWYGVRFPEFLKASDGHAAHPELAEIALIEKTVADAFDALDAPVLGFEVLAGYAPEQWGQLCFAPHPSVTRLDLATNAFALWKALKDDDDTLPAVNQLDAPEHIVIWRQDTAPMVRVMGAEETMMWTEACRGVRFEGLCEMAATFDDPDTAAVRAAGYLQGWLTSHMLTTVTLAGSPTKKRAAKDVERKAPSHGRKKTVPQSGIA